MGETHVRGNLGMHRMSIRNVPEREPILFDHLLEQLRALLLVGLRLRAVRDDQRRAVVMQSVPDFRPQARLPRAHDRRIEPPHVLGVRAGARNEIARLAVGWPRCPFALGRRERKCSRRLRQQCR
jgi:hypothetical protein